MRAQPQGSHFVGGAYVSGDGKVRSSLYPATAEPIAEIADATLDEIDEALDGASEGLAAWRAVPPAERGRILRTAASIVRADSQDIAELETLDTGKPISETGGSDIPLGADCLDYFAERAAMLVGEHIDVSGAEGGFAYTRREPVGVCFGVGDWRNPFEIACRRAAPALACGNAMVFKPSELTPLSALKLADAFISAGVPPGVFSVIQGNDQVTTALSGDPRIALVAQGADGGAAQFILFEDANLDDAVDAALIAHRRTADHRGVRILTHQSVKARLIERLVAQMERLRSGDPLARRTEIGPLVSAAQREQALAAFAAGKADGRLLTGGDRAIVDDFPNGFWIAPTAFDLEDMAAAGKRYGPALTVRTFKGEAQAIELANSAPSARAAVFTRDLARAHRLAAQLHAEALWINTFNRMPAERPFGGVKRCGVGREHGGAAIERHSRLKTVFVTLDAAP